MKVQAKGSMWISLSLGVVFFVTAGQLSLAAPQGGAFPIANAPEREMSVASAFDGINFMVGIQGDNVHYDVGAQLVSPTGSLIGPFVSSGRTGGTPLIAFGSIEYLLVWTDDATHPNNDIWGMVVESAGLHVWTGPISQQPSPEDIAGVAAGPGGFLVTYSREIDPVNGTGHEYGRFISATGVVGAEAQISSSYSYYDDSSLGNIAGDGNGFLAVWVDGLNRSVVKGRLLAADGTPGLELVISNTPERSDFSVTVDFDGTNYLVAWHDEVSSPGRPHWDIHAQLVSPAGALVGGPIAISTAPGDQVGPCIGTDGNLFLVTWTDLRNDVNGDWICDSEDGTCADLYGQYLDSMGALVGGEWPLILWDGDQFGSPVTPGAGKYLLSWTDAMLVAPPVGGDVYGKFLPTAGFPTNYCTAKVNSAGCSPEIWVAGTPSATDPEPCTIGCDLVLNNQFGLMIYGYTPNNVPFQGGTLCIKAPHKRTPVQLSGGTPPPAVDCTGTYGLDFNARIQSGVDPNLVPGQAVYAQYWYRDPLGATYPSGLSDAITFDILP